MCGIAGIINFDRRPVIQEQLKEMNSFNVSRGPDAEGYWMENNIGFCHRRLSIIDLSEYGSQPMEDVHRKVIITFNGEIYNYKELQQELKKNNYSFKSNSDTEVILNGYLAYGIEELLQKLDGMFAFVLYDKATNRAYACRDRFGKKPLYYLYNQNKFSFSSDIRSIWKSDPHLLLDYDSLDYYLSELSVPQPHTIWKEIKQVRPAHYIQVDIDQKSCVEKKYWQINFTGKLNLSLAETEDCLENMLTAAIKKRLVSDVPIGCFLSGGIDSGLITAILASHSAEKINTFSVGVMDDDLNELPLARKLAERYQTNHTEIIVEPNIVDLLPELVYGFGEPFADSSSIPSYYIAREIGKDFKVAIGGDGGDELFGGYYDYRWAYLTDRYIGKYPNKTLRLLVTKMNQLACKFGVTNVNYGLLQDYYKTRGGMKLYREMGFHPNEKHHLYHTDFSRNRNEFTLKYLSNNWNDSNKSFSPFSLKKKEGRKQDSRKATITDTLFEASLKTRLLNDYLVKVDRTSMMNSLEIRSPFLDYQLAEFAASIPAHIKMKDGIQKYLLKKLAVKYIDKDIFKRKKMGFGIPVKQWIKNELKDFVSDLLLSERANSRKIFNRAYIANLLNEHNTDKCDHTHKIWALVCLELWFQKFTDK